MEILTDSEQKYILELARQCLDYYFKYNKKYSINANEVPKKLKSKSATFVTLTIDGELRGCIGKLAAVQELYQDVIENTYLAAFNDWRFPAVNIDELYQIKIEISVLSTPQILKDMNPPDLLAYLSKHKPGLIISYTDKQATFLPQVWSDLPDPEDFLSQLCSKAGLEENFWKTCKLNISEYDVQNFAEQGQ